MIAKPSIVSLYYVVSRITLTKEINVVTTIMANAYPKKRFFIEMFTKDISLEECILDLLDNSIDGVIRTRQITPSEISQGIFVPSARRGRPGQLPTIALKYSAQMIEIDDNCGGIDMDYAQTEAFNFGHSLEHSTGYLGVYGIGLKRALFKLGNCFYLESHTTNNGFSCDIDVRKWLEKDDELKYWKIPLKRLDRAPRLSQAGTVIRVTRLHEEVQMRIKEGTLASSLEREISVTYAFFLETYVRITINGRVIQPFNIPLGKPQQGRIAFEKVVPLEGVVARLFASVASPDHRGRWEISRAGWYVACNGRMVLHADQTDLSGWGTPSMPQFHPKYRKFIGLVFFESEDAHKLPWTTTKRGLNRESRAYILIRNKMGAVAQPVLSYLANTYNGPSDDEEPIDRNIGDLISQVDVGAAVARKTTVFKPPQHRTKPSVTRIQYDAKLEELDLVRNHLRNNMSATAIGRYTFDYFLNNEGLK